MPIPIKFGTKEISNKVGEGKDEKEIKEIVDDIVNNPNPAWTKKPSDLKEENYKEFYREQRPLQAFGNP
jgi:molecular chaperone HtpG